MDARLYVLLFTQRMKCEFVARSVLISEPSCKRNCVPSVAFCEPFFILLALRERSLRCVFGRPLVPPSYSSLMSLTRDWPMRSVSPCGSWSRHFSRKPAVS